MPAALNAKGVPVEGVRHTPFSPAFEHLMMMSEASPEAPNSRKVSRPVCTARFACGGIRPRERSLNALARQEEAHW